MKKFLLGFVVFFLCANHARAQAPVTANLTATGTAPACLPSSCLHLQVNGNFGGATFTLDGSWSGTVTFYASGDSGTSLVTLNVTPSNGTTAVPTTTGNGTWQANVAGYTDVYIIFTTASSGTAIATINPSSASAHLGGGGGGGGGGSVDSVTASLPNTSTGGNNPNIACPTCTTSAASLTLNHIVLGAGSQAEAVLSSLGTTTTVLIGNAAGAPTFGAVNLATMVTGQLGIASVGSAGLSGTSPIAINSAGAISCSTCNTSALAGTLATGQVAFGSSTNTISGSANLTYASSRMTITAPSAGIAPLVVVGTMNTAALLDLENSPTGDASGVLSVNGYGQGSYTPGHNPSVVGIEIDDGGTNNTFGLAIIRAGTFGSGSIHSNLQIGVNTSGQSYFFGGNAVGDGSGNYSGLLMGTGSIIHQLGGASSNSQHVFMAPFLSTGVPTSVPVIIVQNAAGATIGGFDLNSAPFSNSTFTWNGSTSGSAQIQAAAVAGTPCIILLPTTNATSGQFLQAAAPSGGACQTSWQTVSASGSISFPQSVAGTVNSGGIPYFDTTTDMSSSAVLPSGDFVLGGGAGGAPTATFSVVTVAKGGTGTGSTLTGLVRGNASAMTAAELSSDVTTSGSNAATVIRVNGITYSATAAAHSIEVITTANTTATAKVITDCTDTGGNHLNYTQSTDLFSCGTTSSGGGISGLTTGFIPKASSSSAIGNSLADDGITAASTFTYSGSGGIVASSGPVASGNDGTHPGLVNIPGNTTGRAITANLFGIEGPNAATFTGYILQASSTGPSAAGYIAVGAPSSGVSQLTYVAGTPTLTIASGTSTLGTSAIASGACATAVTTTATGTAATDTIMADFNATPVATTGYVPGAMLTIVKYPTSNNVNFSVCNNTASSITPSAVTLNWRVVR